jgi:putative SOS response-associated peptidase YedK
MCGRITFRCPREAIGNEFAVTRFAEVDWHPRYNVAPSQIVETIISVKGEKRLGPMRWGFVSPTAKEPKLSPINARAETLSTSPMFRDAFRRRRCLVVANGLYE